MKRRDFFKFLATVPAALSAIALPGAMANPKTAKAPKNLRGIDQNWHPLHVNCRCTIKPTAYSKDELRALARVEAIRKDGGTYAYKEL